MVKKSAIKCRKVSPGAGVFMKASPMRNPRNPAWRSRRTVPGLEMPLSEIFTTSGGNASMSRSEWDASVWNVPRWRLLIPTTSMFSLRYSSSASVWISSRVSSPNVCASRAKTRHSCRVSAEAIKRTASACTALACKSW